MGHRERARKRLTLEINLSQPKPSTELQAEVILSQPSMECLRFYTNEYEAYFTNNINGEVFNTDQIVVMLENHSCDIKRSIRERHHGLVDITDTPPFKIEWSDYPHCVRKTQTKRGEEITVLVGNCRVVTIPFHQ